MKRPSAPQEVPERQSPPGENSEKNGRILLLGGTGDALAIARLLGPRHLYSIAGLGKTPEGLLCEVRVGGYGGVAGLTDFLRDAGIDLLVDATHPYAAQMSRHAALASRACGVACWTLQRPPWQPQRGDDWRSVSDWAGIVDAIAAFKRPLFTLGREPLAHLAAIPDTQQWAVRCLPSTAAAAADRFAADAAANWGLASPLQWSIATAPSPPSDRATVISARGPFTVDAERRLFENLGIDVVVSKNSGGAATEAKLEVARERGLPIVMLERPALPEVDRLFASAAELIQALDLKHAGYGTER